MGNQLLRHAAGSRHLQGQGGHGARIAVDATVQVRVEHQPAAHKGVHEQIQKTLEIAPAAGHQFGHTGGRGVFGKTHRRVGHGLHLRAQVNMVPLVRHRFGQAQHLVPTTQVERCGHAHAHQAGGQRAQAVLDSAHAGLHHGQQSVGIGKVVGQGFTHTHFAGEVHQQPVGTAPANLDAQRKRAIRVQRHGHRRLANAATHPLLFDQQTIVFQAGGDEANGLGSEAGEARQIGLGQAAIEADGVQHHPFVELAHAHMVGAPRPQDRRGCSHRRVGAGGRCVVSKVHGGAILTHEAPHPPKLFGAQG